MASVKKRPDGSWRRGTETPTVVSMRSTSRHAATPRTGSTASGATSYVALTSTPAPGRSPMTAWSERYFACAFHKRPTTMARDRIVNDKHFIPAIGKRQLSSLTPMDIRALVENMTKQLAPATVRTDYGVLRRFLRRRRRRPPSHQPVPRRPPPRTCAEGDPVPQRRRTRTTRQCNARRNTGR